MSMLSSNGMNGSQRTLVELVSGYADPEHSELISSKINALLDETPYDPANPESQENLWIALAKVLSDPRYGIEKDFAAHYGAFNWVFRDRNPDLGPPIVWKPSQEMLDNSNASKLMGLINEKHNTDIQTWNQLYDWSDKNRAEYWMTAIDNLGAVFKERPDSGNLVSGENIRDNEWFPGARFNPVDTCFLERNMGRTAIVYGEKGSADLRKVTYAELKEMTDGVSNGLSAQGYKPGDSFAMSMPMTPEAVATYLGIIQFGGSVVPIFRNLPDEKKQQQIGIINDSPVMGDIKAIFLEKGVIRGSNISGDITSWDQFLGDKSYFESASLKPDDITEVLFTSGTTGPPKGIPLTALSSFKYPVTTKYHSDLKEDDVFAWPTDAAWVAFHGQMYASLMNGAALALYNGDYGSDGFARFLQDSKATICGASLSLTRKWMKSGCMEHADLSNIKAFDATGETFTPKESLYLMWLTGHKSAIHDVHGGTEMGGDQTTDSIVKESGVSICGSNSWCLGTGGVIKIHGTGNFATKPLDHPAQGEIFWYGKNPGASKTLVNRDRAHDDVYFLKDGEFMYGPKGELLRQHGDEMIIFPNGTIHCLGRTDDMIPSSDGKRISPFPIEDMMEQFPGVKEAALVYAGPDGHKKIVAYLSLEGNSPSADIDLREGLQAYLNGHLDAPVQIDEVIIRDLPRTITGKKTRGPLRMDYESRQRD